MFLYVYDFKLILFGVSVVTEALEVCLVGVRPNDVAVFVSKLDERAGSCLQVSTLIYSLIRSKRMNLRVTFLMQYNLYDRVSYCPL